MSSTVNSRGGQRAVPARRGERLPAAGRLVEGLAAGRGRLRAAEPTQVKRTPPDPGPRAQAAGGTQVHGTAGSDGGTGEPGGKGGGAGCGQVGEIGAGPALGPEPEGQNLSYCRPR